MRITRSRLGSQRQREDHKDSHGEDHKDNTGITKTTQGSKDNTGITKKNTRITRTM